MTISSSLPFPRTLHLALAAAALAVATARPLYSSSSLAVSPEATLAGTVRRRRAATITDVSSFLYLSSSSSPPPPSSRRRCSPSLKSLTSILALQEFRFDGASPRLGSLIIRLAKPGCGAHDSNPDDEQRIDKRDLLRPWSRRRVVVIGKIIVDEYGAPGSYEDSGDDARAKANVTIGGGGPQAAWGAAAALAARERMRLGTTSTREDGDEDISVPPPDPRPEVTFLAPVGLLNWTPLESFALDGILGPSLQFPPSLVASEDHVTPRIRIWHDDNERVRWTPLEGSFDEKGADGLWRDRPSSEDVLDAIARAEAATDGDGDDYAEKGGSGARGDPNYGDIGDNDADVVAENDGDIVLHCIVEAGSDPPGKGLDAALLFDPTLLARTIAVSIEPVVFPNVETGKVSMEDGRAVVALVERVARMLSKFTVRTNMTDDEEEFRDARKKAVAEDRPAKRTLILTPDRPCYDAIRPLLAAWKVTVPHVDVKIAMRDGANGSTLIDGAAFFCGEDGGNVGKGAGVEVDMTDDDLTGTPIPAATLRTPDGLPINPTGAGNAYSAAFAACLGTGSAPVEAAAFATAVGSVVCEYDHLPPWTEAVLIRIEEAAREVAGRVCCGW